MHVGTMGAVPQQFYACFEIEWSIHHSNPRGLCVPKVHPGSNLIRLRDQVPAYVSGNPPMVSRPCS
jgi:hypothetical protein